MKVIFVFNLFEKDLPHNYKTCSQEMRLRIILLLIGCLFASDVVANLTLRHVLGESAAEEDL